MKLYVIILKNAEGEVSKLKLFAGSEDAIIKCIAQTLSQDYEVVGYEDITSVYEGYSFVFPVKEGQYYE
jgi:hypothetical protein